MTAWDWALLFASCALIAIVGYCCARTAAQDDDQAAWQESTTTARTEDDVRRDLRKTRRDLELAQLYEIWPDPPRGKRQIPHQTRRTEDNQ